MSEERISARHAVDLPKEQSADDLMPLVYDELRAQAAKYLRHEEASHTLQATALVNEAYLKLRNQKHADWRSRTHFFYVGSRAMRQILVDHARAKARQKRGGGQPHLELGTEAAVSLPVNTDVLGLNEAIEKLTRLDKRLATIVEMRYFGGMTVSEVAEALDVSVGTVEKDWRMIRAWLGRELNRNES